MKVRLPLYARILIWLGLNLVLLASVFWLLVRTEFRVDALMAGAAGERVQQVADVILGELRHRPRSEWDQILVRFGEAYRVSFVLVSDRGERLAGPPIELPESVRLGMGGGRGPRRPGPPLGPSPNTADGIRRPEIGAPRRFVKTTDPTAYWVVIRAAVPHDDGWRLGAGRLIVRSHTLGAGGLFFDFTPWWIAGGAVVLLSILWWLPFVHGITRSVAGMTAATEQIAEGRFDTRIGTNRADELGRLGQAIDAMASRLEGMVSGQKRFLGDIAHELCSPLARMELALGVLEHRLGDSEAESVRDVREELHQMSALVNELLAFTKAELKTRDMPLSSLPLLPLIERVVSRDAAGREHLQIEVDEGLGVSAEPELLGRALGNLLRNALRYGGNAAHITIAGKIQGDRVALSISDDGPGVSTETLRRLGEPFYRPDPARTRDEGGAGLGLAIVRSCVSACQGTVHFRNREPHGFEAIIELKRAIASVGIHRGPPIMGDPPTVAQTLPVVG